MHGAPPTAWKPYTFPSGRRISARFESGVRGEGNFYVPSLRVEVGDDGYVITARIPGAEREELGVCLLGDVLRITGERRERCSRERDGRREDARYLSRFTREVCLTRAVDGDRVVARFEGGQLTVHLPFLEARAAAEDSATLIEIH